MKIRTHIIIIICTTLMTVGCSQNHKVTKQTPELAKAEEVMFDHPDSALHILESMPIPSARKDKENPCAVVPADLTSKGEADNENSF